MIIKGFIVRIGRHAHLHTLGMMISTLLQLNYVTMTF